MDQHLQAVNDQADEFLGEWFMSQRYDIGGCPVAGCDHRTLREALVNLILKVQLDATQKAKEIME